MTDIHNHLLFGVDDGSKSIEDSVDILRDLERAGYKNVILTPHYIKDSNYSSPALENYKRLKELKEALKENNININLFLGNEIYIDEEILELLQRKEIYSLNGTNFLLIELPISGEYEGYQEIFSFLISKGCNVILAHPERYLAFQKDYKKIDELKKMGVYLQSNIDSLIGRYGEDAEILIKRLLKDKKISFLATDIHHKKHDYNVWKKAREIALKYISEEEYELLVNINPSKLVS